VKRARSLGLLAGAVVAHAGPGVLVLPAVRRRVAPRQHGLGLPGHVALTFDDGPDPASTPRFLAELDRLGWKATFFMLGALARRSPGLAAEVAAAGHEVAVHGWTHVSHLGRRPGAVVDEVRRTRDTLGEVTGTAPRWLRPPYGVMSGGDLLAARSEGLRPVLWTTWGRDWTTEASAAGVAAEVLRGCGRDGAAGPTVLLHDSDCTSAPGSWRSAVGALPVLGEEWARRGWQVGRLSDHGLG
jgi:peptidoglycan-N-acetylglucosamine deacetylase